MEQLHGPLNEIRVLGKLHWKTILEHKCLQEELAIVTQCKNIYNAEKVYARRYCIVDIKGLSHNYILKY